MVATSSQTIRASSSFGASLITYRSRGRRGPPPAPPELRLQLLPKLHDQGAKFHGIDAFRCLFDLEPLARPFAALGPVAKLLFHGENVDMDVDFDLAEQDVLLGVAEGADWLALDLALDPGFFEGLLSGRVGEGLAGHRPALRDHPPTRSPTGDEQYLSLLAALATVRQRA